MEEPSADRKSSADKKPSENKIALIQMVSSQSVDVNLKIASDLIEEAAEKEVGVIFLPENFAALGSDSSRHIGEQEKDVKGPVRSFLSEKSRVLGCWIQAGTLPTIQRPDGTQVMDQRVRAASMVYSDEGREVARYDKIHMFDVDVQDNHKTYRESDSFEAGDHLSLVNTPAGVLGLSVCYDIRFPELYRELYSKGAEMFSIPSAFTRVTGQAHFETLMRARAIENFSYTIAACQGGVHDSGRETYGNSMVVSPWGEVAGRLKEGEGILYVDLDLESQKEIRNSMPVDKQRKEISALKVNSIHII